MSQQYLLMKRGLYWRPDGMGYTGAKISAGRYSAAESLKIVMGSDRTTRVAEEKASLVSPGACPMAVAAEYERILSAERNKDNPQ